jgi:LysM repeat protein
MKNYSGFQKQMLWILTILLISSLACNLPAIGSSTNTEAAGQEYIQGPTVTIQDPAPGKYIDLGETFPIFVSASDEKGVARIELWVDDFLVLSQEAPETEVDGVTPLVLSYGMMGTESGTYALIARAYNGLGVSGESLAINVTVTENKAVVNPVTMSYVTQEGQNTKDIAAVTGRSINDIVKANPGMKNIPNPGQIVAIPGVPGAQPPVQRPAQPPASANNKPFPGINPLDPGKAVGIAAGQNNQFIPNIFPNFQPPQNKLNPGLAAPTGINAIATGCKVSLSWIDNATGESAYTVFRRHLPDEVASKPIKTLAANQTSFIDEVTAPGKYMYSVGAVGSGKDSQNQQKAISESSFFTIQVDPDANCIDDLESVQYAHIEILNVTTKRASNGYAALWYSVNDSPGRRLPTPQGQYNPSGNWGMEDEVVPVSSNLLLNPDGRILVKFWASATTLAMNGHPVDLGEAYNAHRPTDIDAKVDNYYIAENDQFKVEYKIWIEDVRWTGKGTSSTIPAPTNLRIQQTTPTSRRITWDWNGEPSSIDGYILYRSYSCPGMDSKFHTPEMIAAPSRTTEITFRSEPMGCIYRYQVSAYGRKGESAASNSISGNTEGAYGIAGVEFSDITFSDLAGDATTGVKVRVYVNQHRRSSDAYWVQENSYDFTKWVFDGRLPNNSFGVVLAEKEFLTVGFSVSGIDKKGYVSQDSICSGGAILPPLTSWAKDQWSTTIRSSDGSCEVNINLLAAQQPIVTSSNDGEIVKPHTDIAVTRIASAGGQLFAYVENLGPDDLPNNSFSIVASWGDICTNGENHSINPWNQSHIVNVQSNLPQWIHIHDNLDDFYGRTMSGEIFKSHKSQCDIGTTIFIVDPGYYEDPKTSNYVDQNEENDSLEMRFNQIKSME